MRSTPDPDSEPHAWLAAVAAGGRGEIAGARTGLAAIRTRARRRGDQVFASLALSTEASLWRQAGRHDVALPIDGEAWRLVATPGPEARPWATAAALDALVGLAADNLGLFRFGAAARLLDRAGVIAAGAGASGGAAESAGPWQWETMARPALRIEWVRAELAMFIGDAEAARRHADTAIAVLADAGGTHVRHRLKTDLIAAAATSMDDVETAVAGARSIATGARDEGLWPLVWAALSLVVGSGSGTETEVAELGAVRERLWGRGMPFPGGCDG